MLAVTWYMYLFIYLYMPEFIIEYLAAIFEFTVTWILLG